MSPLATLLAYDPNDVKPGWVALIIVALLGVATFLLWRSMNTQLGRIKVPKASELPQTNTAAAPDAPAEPGQSGEDGEQSEGQPPPG